mmetsp:Transcript_17397/g.42619  ORF Transcript_17397/g.42619 Transcript_17397/m.42619 type:complete len:209 (-) Transcript_17397:486-1112(-)
MRLVQVVSIITVLFVFKNGKFIGSACIRVCTSALPSRTTSLSNTKSSSTFRLAHHAGASLSSRYSSARDSSENPSSFGIIVFIFNLITLLRRIQPIPAHTSFKLTMAILQELQWLSILADALFEDLFRELKIIISLGYKGPSDPKECTLSSNLFLMQIFENSHWILRFVSIFGTNSNETIIVGVLTHFDEGSCATLHQEKLFVCIRRK